MPRNSTERNEAHLLPQRISPTLPRDRPFQPNCLGGTLCARCAHNPGLVLVPGSFKFNGTTIHPDPNLVDGFLIGDLLIGQSAVIEFQATIFSLPSVGNTFYNTGVFEYQTISSGSAFFLIAETNPVSINVFTTDPPAPTSYKAQIKKCKYLNRNKLQFQVEWKPPSDAVLLYRVYQNGVLVAEVAPSRSPQYLKCIEKKSQASGFALSAVYEGGFESPRINLRITNE